MGINRVFTGRDSAAITWKGNSSGSIGTAPKPVATPVRASRGGIAQCGCRFGYGRAGA